MKKGALLLLPLLLIVAACHSGQAVRDRRFWNGSVELSDGITVPLRMSLDFSTARPVGYFLVGDEKTTIPEVSRTGDSVTLAFSEYGAEIRSTWDGARLNGNYFRVRSNGPKWLKFTA